MKLIDYRNILLNSLLLGLTTGIFSCGDSDSGDKIIQGNISGPIETIRELNFRNSNGYYGVKICALGQCDISDPLGDFMLDLDEIPAEAVFTITQNEDKVTEIPISLPANSSTVTIQFIIAENGISHEIIEVQNPNEPVSTPEPADPNNPVVPTLPPVVEPTNGTPSVVPTTSTNQPSPRPTATAEPKPTTPPKTEDKFPFCQQCLDGCAAEGQPPAICKQVCKNGFQDIVPPNTCP
jgi:hypothetical protein